MVGWVPAFSTFPYGRQSRLLCPRRAGEDTREGSVPVTARAPSPYGGIATNELTTTICEGAVQLEIRKTSFSSASLWNQTLTTTQYRTSKRSWRLTLKRGACHAGGDGRFRLFKRAQISSFPLKRRSFPLKRRLRATVLYLCISPHTIP
jgi:hypothetical protein